MVKYHFPKVMMGKIPSWLLMIPPNDDHDFPMWGNNEWNFWNFLVHFIIKSMIFPQHPWYLGRWHRPDAYALEQEGTQARRLSPHPMFDAPKTESIHLSRYPPVYLDMGVSMAMRDTPWSHAGWLMSWKIPSFEIRMMTVGGTPLEHTKLALRPDGFFLMVGEVDRWVGGGLVCRFLDPDFQSQ